jgi:hypothetical protein
MQNGTELLLLLSFCISKRVAGKAHFGMLPEFTATLKHAQCFLRGLTPRLRMRRGFAVKTKLTVLKRAQPRAYAMG